MGSSRIRTTRKVSPITVALAIGALVVVLGAGVVAQAAKVPVLVWSPSTNGGYDYGTLDASTGQSASQAFTLTNSDGKSSGLVTITLSGSSVFTKTADTCTGKRLAPKKSCSVTAKYAPTTNGSDTATLTAGSQNAANANLALTGASAWQNGDETTYGQGAWGTGGVANGILLTNAGSVYAGSGGLLVGSQSGFTALWTDLTTLSNYLPAVGPPGPLDADLLNPSSTPSGSFGGDVVALKLDVDFADAGALPGNSGPKFGDLMLCGLTADTDLNGLTVRQALAVVNTALGGGTTTDSIADLDLLTNTLNVSFAGGIFVSTFAQVHLYPGACP